MSALFDALRAHAIAQPGQIAIDAPGRDPVTYAQLLPEVESLSAHLLA